MVVLVPGLVKEVARVVFTLGKHAVTNPQNAAQKLHPSLSVTSKNELRDAGKILMGIMLLKGPVPYLYRR